MTKSEKREVCQNCKSHTNKPSYCHLHKKYVERKETCGDFGKGK